MVLSRLSIQRPILAAMMSAALVLFGIICFFRLPVRELPDIDSPVVSVVTVFPGANAQVVETEVTERLEEAINNIEGIRTLTSESREQASVITVEFSLSRNIDLAAQDVRDRVARARGTLPLDVREPIVAKQDANAQAIIWMSISSDRYNLVELTSLAERQLKPRFQTVPGVSAINIGGEKRFAMRLWLDSEKMAARRVTVLDIQRALREQNVELPSGRVENLDREMTIQTRGQLKSVEEFDNLVIRTDETRLVRLRDVGRSEAGAEDYRSLARNGGRPCVFLGVVKQSKANTVEVAQGVRAQLADLQSSLPAGVQMRVVYNESTFVEKAIHEVWTTLGIAFGLVVLIIFVFLRNLRSTIIPVIAVPVSIVGTFAVMQLLGFSVNILTMLALVLAIGIVVDDAIVVLEAIYRHVEEGMAPRQAAFRAMDEISVAIIAITLSLVAVFLPLAFQRSQTGRLFIEFAVAVAGSVVISAGVALTLSPMMASRLLRPVQRSGHGALFNAFERALTGIQDLYLVALRWSLNHRGMVVLLTVGALVLTVFIFGALEREFLPEEDKGRIFSFFFTPSGSTSEFTDRQARKLEKIVSQVPEIESYSAMVAPGFAGPGQANNGILFMTLKEQPRRSVQEIVNGPGGLGIRFFDEVEGAIAIPSIPKAINTQNGAPFELILQNQDLDALNTTSLNLADRLRGLTNASGSPLFRNVRVSYEVNKPELRIAVDRKRAATLGVSLEEISRTLQILFGGLDLSRLKLGGKEYLVMAQLERGSRLTPSDLDRLFVRSNRGELIQLSSLVTRENGAAPNAINHYARLRSSTISGTPVGIPLGQALDVTEQLLERELPAGFLHAWGGEVRDLREAGKELVWVVVLALIIVYMTLAAQFESLVHPFTVMLALPLAGVGAFGGLWLLDWMGKLGIMPILPAMNLNLFSQIGLVLLIGLVTKNSILLVEYANQQTLKGMGARDAMLEAGRVRLRPILMTALATIVGILPIAIGFGAGAESRRPMGVTVVGGMITSTFLTLFVVPVFYTLLDGLVRRKSIPSVSVATVPSVVLHS